MKHWEMKITKYMVFESSSYFGALSSFSMIIPTYANRKQSNSVVALSGIENENTESWIAKIFFKFENSSLGLIGTIHQQCKICLDSVCIEIFVSITI